MYKYIFAHMGVFLSDEVPEWLDQRVYAIFILTQIALYRSLHSTHSIWECLFPQMLTLILPKGKIKISFC